MRSLTSLMTLIDAYVAATGIADASLSMRVFRDNKKIRSLRHGGDITTSRMDAAVQWFSENWPENLDWPRGVSRPRARKTTSETSQASARSA
jgi:hypothetical protein